MAIIIYNSSYINLIVTSFHLILLNLEDEVNLLDLQKLSNSQITLYLLISMV